MRKIYFFAMMLMVAFIAGCGTETPPTEIEDFRLNKRSITIQEGETYRLRVFFEPESVEELFADKIVWESSKPKVATVDDEGNVTGVKVGECTITATCKGFEASCKVEVEEADPVILTISKTSIHAPEEGGEYSLIVTSSESWDATCTAGWVTLSPTSGSGDNDVVSIQVSPTPDNTEASTTVTFDNGQKTATLSIHIGGKQQPTFSVSATKKVVFSIGNLLKNDADNPTAFSFAEPQYFDYNKIGKRHTFKFEEYDYSTMVIDNDPEKGETWRVLTKDEWEYLLNKRPDADKKQRQIIINSMIYGLCILPDEFSYTTDVNEIYKAESSVNYSEADWKKLEANGAKFMPCIGVGGTGSNYLSVYWTSTPVDDVYAYYAAIVSGNLYATIGSEGKIATSKFAVRLVHDAE